MYNKYYIITIIIIIRRIILYYYTCDNTRTRRNNENKNRLRTKRIRFKGLYYVPVRHNTISCTMYV